MLLSFSITNWKSYAETAEFSMIATREQRYGDRLTRVGRQRVLPVTAIYGANAAGKSTFVRALAALRDIVVGARRPGATLPAFPHLPDGKTQPSRFEIDFLVEVETKTSRRREVTLVYEVEFDRRQIRYEALLIRCQKTEDYLFERTGKHVVLDSEFQNNQRVVAHTEVISDNETVLGAVGSDEDGEPSFFTAAYSWFAQQLTVIFPSSEFVHLPALFDADELFAQAMNAGLSRADTGISELVLEEMKVSMLPLEAEQVDELINKLEEEGGAFIVGGETRDYAVLDIADERPRARRLVARHDISTGPHEESEGFNLHLREESDGTQRFMNLLPVLFQLRQEDLRGVFVIDELENSMHPKLTEEFIRIFLDELGEAQRRQLIFTTHEIQLMRSDILRRDEIWLAEKERGQTQLTRVSDFSRDGVRKDADLLSSYMSGRLGGVPRV
ncbi:ATP-binding protein [Schaalia sp. ZJ1691]|uniref:AAA family ATPase n=1 Tax=Schaalia sp. ZJ1691 TaxID=2709404 RepID=UPI0013EC10C9|nr:ATP-binding protein [Schaalia sp. ZJ1691]